MLKWILALPFALFILFNAYVYGGIITYRALAPHHSAFMTARMAEFRSEGRDIPLDYRWRAYPDISDNLKKALIASEDAAFAEKVLAQAEHGRGVFQVDGKMVDAPVIARAKKLLGRG